MKNNSLQQAIRSTTLSKVRTVAIGKRALPKYAPVNPPAAAAQNQMAKDVSMYIGVVLPNKPLKEFNVIKMAEVAAASLALAQPNKISNGLKKIPPPILSIPDRRPIMAPMSNASGIFTVLRSGRSLGVIPSSRMIGN